MRCDKFENRLQLLLDQRRVPERDSQLVAHAQRCTACREVLSLQSQLFDALELVEIPELPAEFAHNVVALVQPAPNVDRVWPRFRIAPILLAVAATLLLALLPTAIIWLRSNGQEMALDHKQQENLPETPVAAEAADGGNWWALSRSSLATLYPTDVRQRHREQVENFADELRPIATPFTTAATALRRTIPVGKSREEGQPQAAVRTAWPRDVS